MARGPDSYLIDPNPNFLIDCNAAPPRGSCAPALPQGAPMAGMIGPPRCSLGPASVGAAAQRRPMAAPGLSHHTRQVQGSLLVASCLAAMHPSGRASTTPHLHRAVQQQEGMKPSLMQAKHKLPQWGGSSRQPIMVGPVLGAWEGGGGGTSCFLSSI